MLFNDVIRTCGATTKDFLQFFCDELNKMIPNFGRNIQQICVANFLHPYFKGSLLSLLRLSGKNHSLYTETINTIKDLCDNLDLDREERIVLPQVRCHVKYTAIVKKLK
jgi:hypothetical protein